MVGLHSTMTCVYLFLCSNLENIAARSQTTFHASYFLFVGKISIKLGGVKSGLAARAIYSIYAINEAISMSESMRETFQKDVTDYTRKKTLFKVYVTFLMVLTGTINTLVIK